MKNKNIAILGILSFIFIEIASASQLAGYEPFSGDVYLAGTDKGVLLFQHKNSLETNGSRAVLRHIYSHPDGRPATTEEVVLLNGELAEYNVDFPETDECGCRLERKGENVKFSFTRGDKSRTGENEYLSTLATGPTLNSFIINGWNTLLNGEKIYLHFPAMNLQRIVKVRIVSNEKSSYKRDGVVVFKMEIANFLIRLFVDPVDLVYDLETGRLVEIHGKSLLQREVDGKIENPVVDIYYNYGV